ncbi:MAG: LCP family protein [Patescibacteria group bacterium]|nr:LCP family protein [Patescibacteria group bacterium]
MGIIKKSQITKEDQDKKTPIRFSKKNKGNEKPARKRQIKKWLILSFVALVLGFIGFFGIKTYNSIKDVFSGDGGVLNLFGGSQGKLLKGEIDGRVNVLLLGTGDEGHAGYTLSDTIIVASYDTKSKAVSMISIPRDFYVQIPGGNYTKINAAHAYGEQRESGGGPELAIKTVESVIDLPIHYYARVDFTGLRDIVDALDGVTVEVERDFCDYQYTRSAYYKPVCFKAGSQTMDGETALKYARSRKASGVEGSDFARAKRQQNILVAIKKKVLTTETAFNISKVNKIITALGKHLKTNLGINELARVFEISKNIDQNLIIQKNLDPSSGLVKASSGAAGYILLPTEGQGQYAAIRSYFKDVFVNIGIQKENAKISFLNGTWSTYYYTNLYNRLEADGYNIVSDGGTKTRNYSTSQVIDYTNGQKPETIRKLESILGVKATAGTSIEGQKHEIQIIIGSDYKG